MTKADDLRRAAERIENAKRLRKSEKLEGQLEMAASLRESQANRLNQILHDQIAILNEDKILAKSTIFRIVDELDPNLDSKNPIIDEDVIAFENLLVSEGFRVTAKGDIFTEGDENLFLKFNIPAKRIYYFYVRWE